MHTTTHIRAFSVTLVLFALAALPLCADMVVLQNGESLSGTFSRIRENTLIFRTSLQGQMMTPMSEVRTLSADKTLYITMSDGQVYYGRLGVVDDVQQVFPLNGDAPVPIEVTAIQETLPIPTTSASAGKGAGKSWDLSAGTGLQWRSDSAAPVEPIVRLDATGRSENWRLDANAQVERADADDFPAYLRAQGELFGNSEGKTNPYASAEIERDLDRSLELRQNLALGLYHTLYTTENSSTGALAALDLEYEREAEQIPERVRDAHSEYDLNLRLGLRYYRLFAGGRSLSESLIILPSLTADGGFRARAKTAYVMPLTDKLHLRLDLTIGYDNNPLTSDVDRWNATVGAGVNVDF